MGRNATIAACALSAVLFCGCPAGGFFGRYILINSTDSTVTNLAISAAGESKVWDVTLAGQRLNSDYLPGGPKRLSVSWSDGTGDHEVMISLEKKTGYRSKDDLFIELKPNGNVSWRLVKPVN